MAATRERARLWTNASGSGATTSSYTIASTRRRHLPPRHRHGDEHGRFGERQLERNGGRPPGRSRRRRADDHRHGTGRPGADRGPGSSTNSPTSYSYQWQTSSKRQQWLVERLRLRCNDFFVHRRRCRPQRPTCASPSPRRTRAVRRAPARGATGAVLPAPTRRAAVPTITGTAQVGQVLTANHGTWTNSPSSYGYQWQHSGNGTTWTNASGSRRDDPPPTPSTSADAGTTLRVTVTATKRAVRRAPAPAQRARSPCPDTTPPTVSGHRPANGSTVNSQLDRHHHRQGDRQPGSEQGSVLRQQRAQVHRHDRVLQLRLGRAPAHRGVKYTLTVRAYDSSNNTASASVSVTSR